MIQRSSRSSCFPYTTLFRSIVIRDGTYHGPTAVVDKQLTIEGQGHPVLDGENTRGLIIIKADDVTVRGLTLRNVGTSFVEEDRKSTRLNSSHSSSSYAVVCL